MLLFAEEPESLARCDTTRLRWGVGNSWTGATDIEIRLSLIDQTLWASLHFILENCICTRYVTVRNNWQMVVWLVYPDHILANRFIVTGHTIHSNEFHLRAQGLAQIYFQRSELSWARNPGEAIHCGCLEPRAHQIPTTSKAIILDLSCPRPYTHERISSLGSRSYVR
jgi:hypothetical protein